MQIILYITLDSEAEGLNLPKTYTVPLLPVKHCRLVQKVVFGVNNGKFKNNFLYKRLYAPVVLVFCSCETHLSQSFTWEGKLLLEAD